MDCATSRELISARIDGETGVDEEHRLALHLSGCPRCRTEDERALALHRMVRLRSAELIPDHTEAILARAGVARLGRRQWVRFSLAAVGVIGIVDALPDLLLGHEHGVPTHVARHIGALTVAMFMGFLYAAWRPHRAMGLLPVAAALAVTMVVSALVDVSGGAAHVLAESAHLIDVAGVVLLWMLAGAPHPRWVSARLSPA